ncbi:acyl carrier protein [Nonomuraea sp. B12E4]|uniref:acyl carrier protein n=1 Tax=Nonomuraea sp. B12E4 TaxID=3153564 RepID=UPI00325CD043
MTDTTQVVSSVSDVLAQVLNREPGTLDAGTRLFDDLGLDSTAVLEVLMELEDRLGLEIDTDSLEHDHFESVGTLAEFLATQA